MNKNFKGIWLEADLWGLGLDGDNKLLYSEIRSLSKLKNGCTKSNEEFAKLLELNSGNVSRRIKQLNKMGLITCTNTYKGKKCIGRIITLNGNVGYHTNGAETHNTNGAETHNTNGAETHNTNGAETHNTNGAETHTNNTYINNTIKNNTQEVLVSDGASTGTYEDPNEDPGEIDPKVENFSSSVLGRDSSPISECPSRPNGIPSQDAINQEYPKEFDEAFDKCTVGMENRILRYFTAEEKECYFNLKPIDQDPFLRDWQYNNSWIINRKIY